MTCTVDFGIACEYWNAAFVGITTMMQFRALASQWICTTHTDEIVE